MADTLPSHQDLERHLKQVPGDIIARLPNNTASRRASDLLKTVYDYAKESREQPADNAPRRD